LGILLDDLDVLVQLRKLDASGPLILQLNVPINKLVPPIQSASKVTVSCFVKHYGPNGALRASHAVSNIESAVYDSWPQYTNGTQEMIKPGTVVRFELPIWPGGMTFDAGELFAVKVSGHYMSPTDMKSLNGQTITENQSRHTLYFSVEMDRYIKAPLSVPFRR
jgi:hypothetical protein